jgi:hypothetical protein
MSLTRTRFAVRIGGKSRILFSILEKPNGELIVPSKTAEKADNSDGPRLLEQRYSIHPSPKSSEFTMVKQTLNTVDGKTEDSVVLTDAVKLKTGFSIIFVRRVQSLSSDRYVIEATKKQDERTVVLADFDESLNSFFFGVFLGHPDTPFDIPSDDRVVVNHFYFKKFKIILLATVMQIPSHYTTDYSHAVTFRPQSVSDPQSQEVMRYQMQGKPAAICLQQFNNSVKMLAKILWERALLELTEPDLIIYVKEKIAEIDVTLTPVGLGIGPRLVHMLSDGKPPNPQSPQPPAFVRRTGQFED